MAVGGMGGEMVVRRSLPGVVLAVLLTGFLLPGCGPVTPPQFRPNLVELLKQERQSLPAGNRFPESARGEVDGLLTALFGTPDDPRIPETDDGPPSLVDNGLLRMAAGPVSSDREDQHQGLYRKHCAHCHGITGDGAGPTAGMLNPYPRDFRLGKFKFKSTPLRAAPTDADLTRIIRRGIPGTGMPSFQTLPDEHVAALVGYVKYLALRGEMERQLLARMAEQDGRLLPEGVQIARDAGGQWPKEIVELVDELFAEGVEARWIQPERKVSAVPSRLAALAPDNPGHAALVDEGRRLFHAAANCVQCHGDTGLGDGQTENFDDWTNEWMKAPGVLAESPETWIPWIEAGALPPRRIRPRNLNLPVYRGGGSPEELFLRIRNGIEGTPMPSTPALSDDQVWALVALVRAMPYTARAATEPATLPGPPATAGSPPEAGNGRSGPALGGDAGGAGSGPAGEGAE